MNPEPNETLDSRLTDLALGQLSDEEQCEVEAVLEQDAEAREMSGELSRIAAVLLREPGDLPGRSDKLHAAISDRLGQSPLVEIAPRKRGWRRSLVALAVAASACVIGTVILLPATQMAREAAHIVPPANPTTSDISGPISSSAPVPEDQPSIMVLSDGLGYESRVSAKPSEQPIRTGDATIVDGEPTVDFVREAAPPTRPEFATETGSYRTRAKKRLQPESQLSTGQPIRLSKSAAGTTSLSVMESKAKPESVAHEARRAYYSGHHFMLDVIDEAALVPAASNERYESIVENEFLAVDEHPLSTLSIDVDTASYANVRRFLMQGHLPPPNAVRLEEMVNYFSYDYPQPRDGETFSVTLDLATCPWQKESRLLRVGLQGREVPRKERPPCNLVFLLDVSGSMRDDNKLPLLKQAMKLLVGELTENDRVAIVTYASKAGLHLDSTGGHKHDELRAAIDQLSAGGSTNGSAGIQLAYEKAADCFIEDGVNRVILATDGDLNVGVTDDDALVELITGKAESGVFLSVLGFGTGNLKDGKLEKVADNGNGNYGYIDNLREARRVLVEEISATLITIAKDVKIKIEFNPAEVASYRLLGYENRLMTAREFDDDAKDAGEIGAGHSVTALYEIVPAGGAREAVAVSDLKYQQRPQPELPANQLTDAARSGEVLTLSLRYKQPDADESVLREHALKGEPSEFQTAPRDFRFAAAVASFGMCLRDSEYRGEASPAMIEQIATGALGEDAGGYRTEFLDLVRRTAAIRP